MKRQACFLIVPMLAFVVSCTTDPDDDDDGWDAAKVCPETGTNSYGMPNRGTFTDERDGQVYKYTTIGKQVWMAQNLNYDAPYSHCEHRRCAAISVIEQEALSLRQGGEYINYRLRIVFSESPVNSMISSIGLFASRIFFAISVIASYRSTALSKSLMSTVIRYLELKLHNFTSFCNSQEVGSSAKALYGSADSF